MKNFENQTVVLTGATGGIGRALATALADQGARLILVGRNGPVLEEMVVGLPGDHIPVLADLTTSEGLQRLARVCSANDRIDVLINCLGINEFAFLQNQSVESIQRMVSTNLLAPMLVCRALLPQLQRQSAATILNIGSTFGSIGFPGYASYCASKAGLRGFTEALRRELLDSNVAVHYLSPRAVKTTMNSPAVDALNQELSNAVDDPEVVVKAALEQLQSHEGHDRYLGWPERLFVKINGLFPKLVTGSIRKQLKTVRKHAVGFQRSSNPAR